MWAEQNAWRNGKFGPHDDAKRNGWILRRASDLSYLRGVPQPNYDRYQSPPRPLLVYETESLRGTWTPHAVDGWYIGYCEWIVEITAECIDDTMV